MIAKILGVAMLSLASAAVCLGDCQTRVIFQQQTTVVTTPLVATFIPLVVPAYSVTYSSTDAALKAENDRLRSENDQLRRVPPGRMPAAADAPPPAADDAFAVLKNRCAQCHDKSVAAVRGKGLVLLSGNGVAELDAADALNVCIQVMGDKMPPKAPLSAEEKKALAGLFTISK